MKKRLVIALGCIFTVSMLSACGNANANATTKESTESVQTSVAEEITEESVAQEPEEVQKPKGHPGQETDENIEKIKFDDLEQFEVTSTNVTDGVWDTKITNTDNGENLSPELSWGPVEGATCYQVLMIDAGWLHMDVCTEDCALTEGQIDGSDNNKYVGPYPPDGTHTYDVYVVAMKAMPGASKTRFDAGGNDLNIILSHLNTDVDGNTGNVISCGVISGTYTYGD